ncbi:MAG: FkbM family methyltransferase [Paracoccaceae bacterium]
MDKPVFLLRARSFDPMVRRLAEALRDAGAPRVVAVLDERLGASDARPFEKIALTDALLSEMGLSGLPANWGWFCGDVCLYAARRLLPGHSRYVLVESDVVMTGDAAAQCVSRLCAEPADLVAPRLGRTAKAKRYSLGLRALGLSPDWGCLFPLVSVSAAGLAAMEDLRRRGLSQGLAAQMNDEAVLAGAAQDPALTHRPAEAVLGDLLAPDCFDTNPPHLAEALTRAERRDRIFHPVVPLATILDRIGQGEKAYSRHRLRRVMAQALPAELQQIEKALTDTAAPKSAAKPAAVPAAKPAPTGSRGRDRRLAYLAKSLPDAGPIRVLDIGANPLIEGDAPYLPLLRAGLARIWGFEPQAEALAALQARKSDAETYLPHALGDGTERPLYLYRQQGFTSLFRIDPASARHCRFGADTDLTGEITVATRRLDDLAELPAIDLLKIDVQGAETMILSHGGAKLGQALAVVTEARLFPLYHDEPRIGALDQALNRLGFEFLRFLTMKHVGLSRRNRKLLVRSEFAQAVDGDAIYVRDLRDIGGFGDERLVKLALIADSVFDNADLVLRLLEELEDRGRIPRDVLPGYVALLPAAKLRKPGR